jgi:hypothetical protein
VDEIDTNTIRNFLEQLLAAYNFGDSPEEIWSIIFDFKDDLESILDKLEGIELMHKCIQCGKVMSIIDWIISETCLKCA